MLHLVWEYLAERINSASTKHILDLWIPKQCLKNLDLDNREREKEREKKKEKEKKAPKVFIQLNMLGKEI